MILLLQVEGIESLNYGNGSRNRKRKDTEKEDSLGLDDRIDLRLSGGRDFAPE